MLAGAWTLAGLLLLAAAPARAVDLIGTWHVLVHYTDASSGAPEQLRWQDRIWIFARKGSQLTWSEYPIVVFANDEGRFERRSSGQYARVLGAWEPSESQLANIEAGLRINTRGSKKKKLKGSDEEGWQSTSRARAASASVITYQENWSITGWNGLPVFEQKDVMASARTEALEGVTRYETTDVEEDGLRLLGRYERDGTRQGRFVMRRAGAVARLEERSQAAIQQAAFQRSLAAAAREEAARGVDRVLAETGMRVTRSQHDALVREAFQGVARGRGPREVSEALLETLRGETFAWAPVDPEPSPAARYRLPYRSDEPRELRLGFREAGVPADDDDPREERDRYTLVFALPSGAPVVAARAGRVVQAGDVTTVLHEDGTFAVYTPLADTSVAVDAAVESGAPLGRSGGRQEAGFTFGVYALTGAGEVRSLRVRFDDGSAEGFEPAAGRAYPGDAATAARDSP